jgi:hypothetical protein
MSEIHRSLHGRSVGLDHEDNLVARQLLSGYGYNQIEARSSPDRVAQFEDFCGGTAVLGTTLPIGPNAWRSRVGSDAQCVNWTITDSVVNGEVTGTIGDTTASMAVSGIQLDSGLNWKANQGGLILQARVKFSQITTIAVFIGFTDQVAALEMPIHSAASVDTITTNATDGLGFFFDTSMSTDNWWIAGVANNVDATHQNSGLAPVADTYAVFRIEVGADGSACFFYNGKVVGTKMTGATTATVALTPVVAAFNRNTTGTPTVTVDYINVAGNRA